MPILLHVAASSASGEGGVSSGMVDTTWNWNRDAEVRDVNTNTWARIRDRALEEAGKPPNPKRRELGSAPASPVEGQEEGGDSEA